MNARLLSTQRTKRRMATRSMFFNSIKFVSQMTLPSYEEAMRTSSTIHHHNHHHVNRYVWPMAPPPYDAVVSSSSSASSNLEPAASAAAAAAPAIENPPTAIHHEEPTASSSASCRSRPVDERIVEISAAEPRAEAVPSGRQTIVCIDHRSDDSEAGGADDASAGLSLVS